ncbi:hypothetical protein [Blautia sp.]|uniref:Uncharacterized protein n=1 Tax=Blautia argi TaxID=1912897 RepID=A0A2Z4UBC2_9FIRM|nr:hypothetical protein [Blautia sp.]AWY98316.1 hypothetical protein DQQ01_09325 [Blautia argi]
MAKTYFAVPVGGVMHILQNDTVQEFEILYDLKMKTVLQNHRRFLQVRRKCRCFLLQSSMEDFLCF